MQLTFNEIVERLKTLDELTLLELLDISSEDIVVKFADFIEDRLEQLSLQVQWEDEQNGL